MPRSTSRRQRAELLRADRKLRADLLAEYTRAWKRIKSDLERLTAEMAAARAAGETVGVSWLIRRQRLQVLEQKVRVELSVFADFAERKITEAQIAAAQAADRDAGELLRATLGPPPPGASVFTPALPVQAIDEIVGRSAAGTPLGELLAALGPDAAQSVRSALVQGVASGRNPREVARTARAHLGGNLARALTIARTETLGAYRTVAGERFRAADVVTGWTWVAQLSHRTCPVCWAMHGTEHAKTEILASHPACRCTMAPITKTWKELGFEGVPETRPTFERGPAVFARADPALQRAVLGPGKLRAYQAGQLRLEDLVARTRSAKWGPGLRERSLRDILAGKGVPARTSR